MPELMRAVNRTRGTVVCARLERAAGVVGKSRGLLGRAHLEEGWGMLFEANRFEPFMLMHMFFMRFPIDIVFLDANGRVLKIHRSLKPWRVSALVFGARRALEIAAGAITESNTEVGDQIA
jgi:uncharacterized membrane protein (UPF0127 family)